VFSTVLILLAMIGGAGRRGRRSNRIQPFEGERRRRGGREQSLHASCLRPDATLATAHGGVGRDLAVVCQLFQLGRGERAVLFLAVSQVPLLCHRMSSRKLAPRNTPICQ